MRKHRVVITGIGALTPCGVGWEQLWQSVLAAKSANVPISRFDPSGLQVSVAAEIRNFAIEDFMVGKPGSRLDRSAQLALSAGQLAFNDASASLARLDRRRCGVFDGSSLGALAALLEEHRGYLNGQRCRGGPGTLISGMTGNSSAAWRNTSICTLSPRHLLSAVFPPPWPLVVPSKQFSAANSTSLSPVAVKRRCTARSCCRS